ncbi:MAG: M17 family peptidase N-terminal domain-containing protein [Candidatus Melainabacteria bacterium]|nr:M17 family peptidase N-terminal domain-containing protein [Candidatus Melainabacteria bacterium]
MSKSKQKSRFEFEGLPISFLVNPLFGKSPDSLATVKTDLLVLDLHEHMRLGGGPKDIDNVLNGAIARAIKEHKFAGALGDSILVQHPSTTIGNVLVVGVGKAGQFKRSTLCGFIRFVIETAMRLGAQRVTLPVFPGRLEEISVSGTLAVIRCRAAQFASAPDGLGSLKEIEFLCAPQARRLVAEGLEVAEQLCHSCSAPKIA